MASACSEAWRVDLHEVLKLEVADVIEPIQHLEAHWSAPELVKRLAGYIYKAAVHPELPGLEWRETVAKIVQRAMDSYCGACFGRPWFYELNLEPPLCIAVWKVLTVEDCDPVFLYSDIQTRVAAGVQEKRDHTILVDAVKNAAEETFEDELDAAKISECLLRGYAGSVEKAAREGPAADKDDIRPIKAFIRTWLHDSMGRAWTAVRNPSSTLSRNNILTLFQGLVSPFGDNNPFSCVPMHLLSGGGPPPREWEFLGRAVDELFHEWDEIARRGKKAGDKKKWSAASSAARLPSPSLARESTTASLARESTTGRVEQQQLSTRAKPRPRPKSASLSVRTPVVAERCPSGHDRCAVGDECAGSASDNLIQHWIDTSTKGSIFCRTCWNILKANNPDLKGQGRLLA